MSDSSQHEEQIECPLCMEPLDVDDLSFYPCSCGYQICRFCWHRIRTDENELCPACRKAYSENPADFTPLSQEQVKLWSRILMKMNLSTLDQNLIKSPFLFEI
uniref:CSON012299 protein n=1 Tax=Culicoides sonorensis TaxID=179676 RepID=A0A336LLJ7_CULSO